MERGRTFFKITFLFSTLYIISGAELRCYSGINRYTVISMENPNSLMYSSCNCSDRTTVIFAHGLIQKLSDYSPRLVLDAYLTAGKVNVLGLSWPEESGLGTGGLLAYVTCIFNLIHLGRQLGRYLVQASNVGFNVNKLHLIGFSLGAQMMGYAGREMQQGNIIVPRITGLDPAGPLFEGLVSFKSLDSESAKFVDILHSNPGILGISGSVGTIDIWVNRGNKFQPGCENTKITSIGFYAPSDICSHVLACKFFAEAVKGRIHFRATRATDCDASSKGGTTGRAVYLGDNIDTTATGIYYLTIDSSTTEYQTKAAKQENYEIQSREIIEAFPILNNTVSLIKKMISIFYPTFIIYKRVADFSNKKPLVNFLKAD